ncbi:hypothetical protein [Streptomyces sp. NPDC060194]|uniref:hypothetical protein n=1 Tax=Streptomyces sp. NPDC060194 TaxID=3347069 RepID=UPI00364B662B
MDTTRTDAELKKELDATLRARRDLGEEYDSALVDSFLEKVEQRLDGVVERRVRRQVAEQQMSASRGRSPARPDDGFGSFAERFGFAMVSLILAIPLSAIAVVNAGTGGLFIAWLGIVGVNAVNAARPWARRRRRESDWEG